MLRFHYSLLDKAWRFGQALLRRVTPAGLLALAALVLAGAAGIDTELTLAYQLFGYASGLLLVGFLASWRLAGRYEVERRLPALATVGEPLQYRITVRNRDDRPRAGLAVIEQLADTRPTRDEVATGLGGLARLSLLLVARRWQYLARQRTPVPADPHPLPDLPASGEASTQVGFVPTRRGSLAFRRSWLARRDPLGLFRALRPLDTPQSLLVLPRRYPVPEIATPGHRAFQPGGVTFASSVGDSEEFLGLRDYRPGDPLQHIHWKSFARVGRPIVKEFQSEFFERHALVLDTATAHADAAFEEAVSVAASFACRLDTQECLLDLLFVGDRDHCYTAGRGQLDVEGLLEVLAHVQPCPARDVDALEATLAAHRERLTGCLLVLLGWDAPRRRLVERLRATGLETLAFVITDAALDAEPGVWPLRVGHVAADLAGVATGGGSA
ncbi:MAG: DUF58 domain-containing protein [Gammaproteobacteria bacterium]|jgi:uncharacterized protein (DUF58 family)|nr:DUF58 domain-containing protein [Gammaproteobacteria bacterium]